MLIHFNQKILVSEFQKKKIENPSNSKTQLTLLQNATNKQFTGFDWKSHSPHNLQAYEFYFQTNMSLLICQKHFAGISSNCPRVVGNYSVRKV